MLTTSDSLSEKLRPRVNVLLLLSLQDVDRENSVDVGVVEDDVADVLTTLNVVRSVGCDGSLFCLDCFVDLFFSTL